MTEIRCFLEKEGFIAHYFPGTREKNKAIIVVGGASCNEATCVSMSGYLRRAGYNVLCKDDDSDRKEISESVRGSKAG